MENSLTDNLENISYNEAIREIETILREMQSDDCDIDKLAVNTKRAAALIETCRRRLIRTEEEVQKILQTLNAEQ